MDASWVPQVGDVIFYDGRLAGDDWSTYKALVEKVFVFEDESKPFRVQVLVTKEEELIRRTVSLFPTLKMLSAYCLIEPGCYVTPQPAKK